MISSAIPAISDWTDYCTQLSRCTHAFRQIRDEDIQVGSAIKTEVFSVDKVNLFHYNKPETSASETEPVLIVYGLIGSYKMIDLQEDRSLVRSLQARGIDLYVIDWGHPSRADQYLSFDDYIEDYLQQCVDYICASRGIEKITLLGICEGGTFSAMYAARHPEKVKNLILTITPIDFAADVEDLNPQHGLINVWTRNMEDKDVASILEAWGNLPGEFMSGVFQAMTPARTISKYALDMVEAAADEKRLMNFLRMEKWLADRPHHPGAAAMQWLVNLYKNNELVKGKFMLNGEPVDLRQITMPVLNIYAEGDHIIPPPCSKALRHFIESENYTEMALPGGHVGVYVSSKSQGIVGDGIYSWLGNQES